jgi:hypothetical protein
VHGRSPFEGFGVLGFGWSMMDQHLNEAGLRQKAVKSKNAGNNLLNRKMLVIKKY